MMGEQTVVYSYDGKLFSNRKDDSPQHCDERKKPGTKEYIQYDSTYIKVKNGQK